MSKEDNGKSKKNPTKEILDGILETICQARIDAKSTKKEKCIEAKKGKGNSEHTACFLEKAEDSLGFYSQLKFCTTSKMFKKTELIQTKTIALGEANAALESEYMDLIKSIGEIENKMTEVQAISDKMDRCIEEEKRCNPDLWASLKGFEDDIMDIKSKSKKCTRKITKAFEAGINIAGILTFSDVESLQENATEVFKSMKDFDENVAENITFGTSQKEQATENLMVAIQTAVEADFTENKTTVEAKSMKKLMDFLCDPDCPTCLDDYEDSIEMCCSQTCGGEESDGKDDEPCCEEEEEMDKDMDQKKGKKKGKKKK